jgi:tRNA threonylcarbamoyladenosine biosynthesis protein TsaB
MSNQQFSSENPPLVLAVDTSSASASFALARGNEVLAMLKGDPSIPHSKTFFLQISELLRSAGRSINDVQLFAAATGPGSFTGLRVGLAAVKGLAQTLNAPLIGVNSFDAVALASKVSGEVLAMLEAGRHESYFGFRRIAESGLVHTIGEDKVGAPDKLLSSSLQNLIVTGAVSEEVLNNWPSLKFRPAVSTSAEEIALYAPKLWLSGADCKLRPHYVRPSDAEIKRKD